MKKRKKVNIFVQLALALMLVYVIWNYYFLNNPDYETHAISAFELTSKNKTDKDLNVTVKLDSLEHLITKTNNENNVSFKHSGDSLIVTIKTLNGYKSFRYDNSLNGSLPMIVSLPVTNIGGIDYVIIKAEYLGSLLYKESKDSN